jgi:tetratricopeptide (TPR) repeat protein
MRTTPGFRGAVGAARLILGVSLGTVACALLPTNAAAADARDAARALATRAATEFKLAHFQEALDLYTQAYERFPAPALLFNLGQCNKNLGHYERALFFFQGYLRDKPDAPNRAAVETLIAEASKALANERAAQAEAEAEHARLANLEAERLAAEAQVLEATAHQSAASPSSTKQKRPALIIAGAVGGGIGLVLLGTAVYLGAHSASEATQLSQLSMSGATWTAHDQAVYSNGVSSAHAATGLYIAGGVITAAGVGVAVWGFQGRGTPAVTAGVGPAPGGASARVSWAF